MCLRSGVGQAQIYLSALGSGNPPSCETSCTLMDTALSGVNCSKLENVHLGLAEMSELGEPAPGNPPSDHAGKEAAIRAQATNTDNFTKNFVLFAPAQELCDVQD